MKLDPRLWEALEEHGVEEAHLRMLLHLLQLQRNGQLSWHFVHGHIQQCDVRLLVPSKRADMVRLCEGLLTHDPTP